MGKEGGKGVLVVFMGDPYPIIFFGKDLTILGRREVLFVNYPRLIRLVEMRAWCMA